MFALVSAQCYTIYEDNKSMAQSVLTQKNLYIINQDFKRHIRKEELFSH